MAVATSFRRSVFLESDFSNDLLDRLILLVLWKSLDLSVSHLPGLRLIVCVPKHLPVMLQHFLGKAFEDPGVLERLQGGHSLDRVPLEARVQEAEEALVSATKDVRQLLLVRLPDLAS